MCKDEVGNIVPYYQEVRHSVQAIIKRAKMRADDINTRGSVPLQGIKWVDGSVHQDLPMNRLAELFNVNHFIVSQTNPHVLPFLAHETYTMRADWLFSSWLPQLVHFLGAEIKSFILNVCKNGVVAALFIDSLIIV